MLNEFHVDVHLCLYKDLSHLEKSGAEQPRTQCR